MSKTLLLCAAASTALLAFSPAHADDTPTLYGNSASFSNNPIHQIDKATGVEFQRNVGQPNGNGRGVVTIGNNIYYTVVSDPHIYTMDKLSGLTTGSLLTQNASMSTLAWDGSNFWTADYSGTNQAFVIDPVTGMNIKTITLTGAQNNMDGLEYFNGMLIGNRCDACNVYDIWDLDGNVLHFAFITAPSSATGIAYDGTNFYVSNIFDSSVGVYDYTTGNLLNTINLTSQDGAFLIEDLSFDYAARSDTGGPGAVPEPSTWALMILGFGFIGGAMRSAKRRRKLSVSYA
jgi:glutamine cyclotransferase